MVRVHVSVVARWSHGCRVMWRAAENAITIAAAGAVEPLVALLASPAVDVQRGAAWALAGLASNGMQAPDFFCRVAMISV